MIDPFDQAFLTKLFEAAVAAADPRVVLPDYLPQPPKGRTVVVGAGKGAAQMAAAFEEAWDGPLSGVVVTRYGYGATCRTIKVLEAAHPVPDAPGLAATKAMFDAVEGLGEDDLVVALICGGGSALLPAPPDGLALADEAALNSALLASGAPITAMNAIRKQFSRIKGGRLAAAAHPARVVSLIVSDIPGDDPAMVASGPTVPDGTTQADALAAIDAFGIRLPDRLDGYLRGALPRAPLPADPAFAKDEVHVVASAKFSLESAAKAAEVAGIPAVILSDCIEGEARDVGLVHAAIAKEVRLNARPFRAPIVILSGGETTVTLSGDGRRGGRNSEFLLSAAVALDGANGVTILAADTDGIDGSEDNAGAFADGSTAARIRATGADPRTLLAAHDAWDAFDRVGDLFVPGPTGTNVNDFRAILVR